VSTAKGLILRGPNYSFFSEVKIATFLNLRKRGGAIWPIYYFLDFEQGPWEY